MGTWSPNPKDFPTTARPWQSFPSTNILARKEDLLQVAALDLDLCMLILWGFTGRHDSQPQRRDKFKLALSNNAGARKRKPCPQPQDCTELFLDLLHVLDGALTPRAAGAQTPCFNAALHHLRGIY
jgi:hypothetical protein